MSETMTLQVGCPACIYPGALSQQGVLFFSAGGHIASCVNLTSEQFRDPQLLDIIISQHCATPITKVVVHCMFSQQRGPQAASRLAQRLAERGLQQPAVSVMRGGFRDFAATYSGTELVHMDQFPCNMRG